MGVVLLARQIAKVLRSFTKSRPLEAHSPLTTTKVIILYHNQSQWPPDALSPAKGLFWRKMTRPLPPARRATSRLRCLREPSPSLPSHMPTNNHIQLRDLQALRFHSRNGGWPYRKLLSHLESGVQRLISLRL